MEDYYNELTSPLISLPASRFSIEFKARKKWKIQGMEGAFRGRIGLNLRRSCCPFPDSQNRLCESCELSGNCLYNTLFTPILNKLNKKVSSARPFVFAINGIENDSLLNTGQTGTAKITLLGPAITYSTIFIEACVTALNSFPLIVKQVKLEKPEEFSNNGKVSWPLTDWIMQDNVSENIAALQFKTPVRLTKDEKLVREEITFLLLIQSLIRRLRDLKRAYNNEDGDMGKADKDFYSMAGKIDISENNLNWTRQNRYSTRQGQKVLLDGFTGMINYEGNVSHFLPLLKAGEIVHIGKGTSSGNGRIELINN